MDHYPSQMSGGEQQRVAIARAIAKRPDVLLCDEPTGALDVKTGVVVLEALEQVNRELGTTTAVITHNAVIASMADRVVLLSDGRVQSTRHNESKTIGQGPGLVKPLMTALNRKLLSNLWQMKSQVFAIAMVMASGVAVFVMSQATLTSLRLTQETYYERYRFADVFSHLRRAPDSLKAQIEAIPNVNRVQTRVAESVILDIPDFAEPVVGQILGIPPGNSQGLNPLYLAKRAIYRTGT